MTNKENVLTLDKEIIEEDEPIVLTEKQKKVERGMEKIYDLLDRANVFDKDEETGEE